MSHWRFGVALKVFTVTALTITTCFKQCFSAVGGGRGSFDLPEDMGKVCRHVQLPQLDGGCSWHLLGEGFQHAAEHPTTQGWPPQQSELTERSTGPKLRNPDFFRQLA